MGPYKARTKLGTHCFDFADATGVFDDPGALTLTGANHGEDRNVTLGRDLLDRLIMVVWT